MDDFGCAIPPVDDEDIEWACRIMGLDFLDDTRREFLKMSSTVDLGACPGSGKTTLIVAKLAMLARRWPHKTRGICVLSHTNVAREQIQDRLGRTAVGGKLLSYPHFIDTIHGFVNRFLALPWLYSNGYPSPTIEDSVTASYRRRVLGEGRYRALESFLERKRLSFDGLRIVDRNLGFEAGGKAFPAGISTNSYRSAKEAIEVAAREGYFCYDEIFVWGNALVEDFPQFSDWVANRFPLVIIDEMQDTSETQAALLNSVFPRDGEKAVVVRVGDPNQEIFDLLGARSNTSDPFPDVMRCMEIPTSLRFGSEIASLASPFAVREVGANGLCGVGPRGFRSEFGKGKHAIFVFPNGKIDGILEAYAEHALDVLGEKVISEGVIAAIGHIHRRDDDIGPDHAHYPKSVGNYWEGYIADMTKKDVHPRTFAEYVWLAQDLVYSTRSVALGVEKVAFAAIRLARQIGDIGNLKRKVSTHRSLVAALESEPTTLMCYRQILSKFILEREELTENIWPAVLSDIRSVAVHLCNGDVDWNYSKSFLKWPSRGLSHDVRERSLFGSSAANVYRVDLTRGMVDVKLGSIHSVKGQTHLATLLLNTYWYGHSMKCVLPWLLGNKANGTKVGKRDLERLRHTPDFRNSAMILMIFRVLTRAVL